MKNLSLLFLGISLTTFSACKKKAETEVKDCDKNNYGVITVTFAATTYRHSVLVTYPGTANSREKIVAKGQASDTLHLAPNATAYPVSISSLDDTGAAIDQTNKTTTISKCSEETLAISF